MATLRRWMNSSLVDYDFFPFGNSMEAVNASPMVTYNSER